MQYAIFLIGCALLLGSTTTAAAQESSEPAGEAKAIAEIEKLGGVVRQIAQNTDEKEAYFHLSGKELTDEGLRHLQDLENLVWLNLAHTKITDDGLAQLSGIDSLTRLHLEQTGVGDAGLAHLAGLEHLKYLNLYGTQVTDAGIEHLKGLANLEKLYLWQTGVTPAGAAKLKQALAKVDINLGAELSKPVEEKTLAKGQYVRVRLSGENRILQLAEVQVFEKETGEELQKSATSRQSSTYEEAGSQRAHDGNTDQNYAQGSVSHTNEEKDPWWVLDLGEVKDIAKIKVHNRGDCCGDRLQDATVDVIDASLSVVWSGKVEKAEDGSVTEFVAESE